MRRRLLIAPVVCISLVLVSQTGFACCRWLHREKVTPQAGDSYYDELVTAIVGRVGSGTVSETVAPPLAGTTTPSTIVGTPLTTTPQGAEAVRTDTATKVKIPWLYKMWAKDGRLFLEPGQWVAAYLPFREPRADVGKPNHQEEVFARAGVLYRYLIRRDEENIRAFFSGPLYTQLDPINQKKLFMMSIKEVGQEEPYDIMSLVHSPSISDLLAEELFLVENAIQKQLEQLYEIHASGPDKGFLTRLLSHIEHEDTSGDRRVVRDLG